jgi:hypothetical protein
MHASRRPACYSEQAFRAGASFCLLVQFETQKCDECAIFQVFSPIRWDEWSFKVAES